MPRAYITTSWDDGHPYDLRIAELLAKHGLKGTFYVPFAASHRPMSSGQMRELGRAFEIGAHTVNHVVLTRLTDREAWEEIAASKAAIEDTTGAPCLMFCPPHGKYSRRHAQMVERAGYIGLRSVELGSLDHPRPRSGIWLMPTTVQAYPHGPLTFCKNAAKRAAPGNLWRYLRNGHSRDWLVLARAFAAQAAKAGGVFHLWGHSWEVEETGQWRRLDEVLGLLAEIAGEAPAATNSQLCRQAERSSSPHGLFAVAPGQRSGQ